MTSADNISAHLPYIEFQMSSSLLVLIDPIVLDGLSVDLEVLSTSDIDADPLLIRRIPGPMRIGLQQVENFAPGTYRLSNSDVEASTDDSDARTFDIDTGTLIVVDLVYLARLSTILDWDRYDRILQSPAGDHSGWIQVAEELGGPYFGILWGDVSTPFKGDGRYRIRERAPVFQNLR